MNNDTAIQQGDAVMGIGRGSGYTIKQLNADVNAAMDRLNLQHTHGQGSAWGRGGKAGLHRGRFVQRRSVETEAALPHLALANGDLWAAL